MVTRTVRRSDSRKVYFASVVLPTEMASTTKAHSLQQRRRMRGKSADVGIDYLTNKNCLERTSCLFDMLMCIRIDRLRQTPHDGDCRGHDQGNSASGTTPQDRSQRC